MADNPSRPELAGLEDNLGVEGRNAQIHCGTCGWTDRTLIQSGFYPAEVKSATDRLGYYAQQFSLVEVDSTYYAPPSRRNCELWAERTPAGFTFNIKAYGLLTHHAVDIRTLPQSVRAALPAAALGKRRVYPSALSTQADRSSMGNPC